MLANLRIRWKLVAIFLLPALTLSTVAVTRIVSTLSDGFQADRELRSLQFSTRVAALAGELQGERTLSTQWAGTGKAQGGEELTTQRARVDRALADLRANAEELGPELGGARVTKAWQTAQERLEALVTHRRSLDRFPSTPAEAQTVFTAAVTDLLNLNAAIAAEASDPDVLRTASSYVAVTSMKEFAGQQRDLGLEAILARTFAQGGRERLTSAIAAEIAWVKRFQATASDAQWTQLATRISSPDVAEAGRLRSALLSEARQGRITADGRTWLTATAARQDALRQEESALAADVLAANRAVAVRMKQRLINDILITLFVLALALGFAMNMARSMVRPLARLRDTANDVAERRLPEIVERLARSERIDPKAEAVSVGTEARDEIGDVARAFKSTHEVAVQVATEQAALRKSIGDMFLNLARRSQSLIDRQLELIDDLERTEADPDALDNLFKLDHLATRMRRNSEDLIVLSGAEPARRWSQPVPLVEVVRAALAEVEDYNRVELLPIDEIGVTGQAVSDVVHLLAELIENATSFSPPGTKVQVAGQAVSNGYVLEIEDRGLGMSDDELVEANERLANPPMVDFALSRMLGLYVVARLAQRYNVKVQLRHSWYGGITALVLLPPTVAVRAPMPEALEAPPSRRAPAELIASARPAEPVAEENGEHLPIFEAARSDWFEDGFRGDHLPLRRHAAQQPNGRVAEPTGNGAGTHGGGGANRTDEARAEALRAEAMRVETARMEAARAEAARAEDEARAEAARAEATKAWAEAARTEAPADAVHAEPEPAPETGPQTAATTEAQSARTSRARSGPLPTRTPGASGPPPGGAQPFMPASPADAGQPPAAGSPLPSRAGRRVDRADRVDRVAAGRAAAAARAPEPRMPEPAQARAAAPDGTATSKLQAASVQTTKAGLPRRVPRANLAPGMVAAPTAATAASPPPGSTAPPSASAARSPEEVRSMLSSYRSGLERGRMMAAGEDADRDGDAHSSSRSDDDDATQ
jgi:signal transduction histidine kinase